MLILDNLSEEPQTKERKMSGIEPQKAKKIVRPRPQLPRPLPVLPEPKAETGPLIEMPKVDMASAKDSEIIGQTDWHRLYNNLYALFQATMPITMSIDEVAMLLAHYNSTRCAPQVVVDFCRKHFPNLPPRPSRHGRNGK